MLPSRHKRFLFKYSLIPPKKWRSVATFFVAIIVGMGLFLIDFSNASSYLSDDPQACVNCHIMQPQYITWTHSSHREVANCNACHVPQGNVFNKYFFKAKDGMNHASIFTARAEAEVIRALPPSVEVIQNNCIRCHQDQVTDAKLASFVVDHVQNRTDRTCWECHRDVPHGKVRSLSAVGAQIEPIREYTPEDYSVVPKWLRQSMDEISTHDEKK
ncbi:MAG: cytochrome c nitrite reductase small subunit [Cyclobacteriaceae bacterium]|nr:cytochrome c nitrite reductase small subunit [Cyclobacteriaceae bacterium]